MLSLEKLISHHARFRGDLPAVTFGKETLTWSEFAARVNRVANLLLARGIRPGDRVATVLANCRELLEVYWAVPTIGAVLVPLSPMLNAPGLASLLRDSGARAVFTQRSMLEAFAGLDRECLDALAGRCFLVDGAATGFAPYADATAAAPADAPGIRVSQDALFNIMYTSGTTGAPKGIQHTHFIRAMYALTMAPAWRMTPESVAMHSGSIVFNGAFVTLMPAFYLGARYVLLEAFDPEAVIECIGRERVTHTMLVPAQIIAILGSPAFEPAKLSSLEMILSLGAPLLQEHKDRLNALLPGRFHELYGLTEGFVTILDKHDAVRKSGSVGAPPMFAELRIVDEEARDVPAGEVGEIAGRSPILMTGYAGREDLTRAALRDGWLLTGDLGRVDDEGFLYLVDRKKDMIDSGGVKVYPKDIEEIAGHHPAIREVAVFGIPHEKWGETPVAAVTLVRADAATAEELRDWINARVSAKYQRVARVEIHADFPRSAAGKTLKRELREPYWSGKGRAT
jgi:acyl-CoA synthetase (AMP-forming)/AMP-acid ligase II